MAKIIFTEAQFKNYMRYVLNEQRSADYAKAILKEELKNISNTNKK